MVELGLLGDHEGDEGPALRCRAPPEGQREPRGTSGGVGDPRGQREGPQVSDPGGVTRQGADVAGLPGGGGGAPHHGCGRQQLAPPGHAQRPHPLALPPAKPAAATAPTPTQAATQVTAQTTGAREWGGDSAARRPPKRSRAPRPTPPPTIQRDEGARATSRGREGGDREREGEPTAPQPTNR